MTPLRQKMIRAMDLKNLSPHTRRSYLNAVTKLANQAVTIKRLRPEANVLRRIAKADGSFNFTDEVKRL